MILQPEIVMMKYLIFINIILHCRIKQIEIKMETGESKPQVNGSAKEGMCLNCIFSKNNKQHQ